MTRISVGLAALLALSVTMFTANASDGAPEPTSRISGYALFDYEYVVGSADEDTEGVFGAKVRRVYLTYDYALRPNYKARVRVETNHGVNVQTGPDKSVVGLLVKDAYMQWDVTSDWAKSIKPSLVLGIQSTPSFGHVEEGAWRYRSLEKTHLDLRRIASSRDLGVGVKGKLGDSGVSYQFMVGNDTTKAETNREKRFYGSVAYRKSNVVGEAYGHTRQGVGDESEFVAKALAGYDTGESAGYVSAFSRTVSDIGSVRGSDQDSTGVSAFGRHALSDKVDLVARADIFDPDADVEDDAKTLLILGAAYRPSRQVAFIPNVLIEMPESSDEDPEVLARVTVHYRF